MKLRYTCVCLLIAAPFVASAQVADSRIDGERLNRTMQQMKTYGINEAGGSERVAYSTHNKDALEYLSELMKSAGMNVHIDVAGNLVGRREGSIDGLAPIVVGSHIDTVPNGGHYDGIVGVMSAIEVARTVHDKGLVLEHPLEVVVWSNEEGGKTGSRSYAGTIADREVNLPSLGDKTLGEGMDFLGGDSGRLQENEKRPGEIAGYVELHVEQGAILDRQGVSIGVVEGIVGIKRWNVSVTGFANHAGTTPMDQRQDALYAAAHMIVDIRRIVTAEEGRQVGTVGRLSVQPGAPNVIPGRADFSLEIRDLGMEKIDLLFDRIEKSADAIADENGTNVEFDQYYESPAAITDDGIKRLVSSAADTLGLSSIHMPSGAGHDAQSLKDIAPIGMIFVPSRDGVSHAPSEHTSERQITDGANVLLKTMVGMDQLLQ